ncbi:MAG: hypothetical protein WCP99_08595 [Burkholderiales bacterium]
MPEFEYQLLSIFRALVEVAGLFLLGQAALYVLAGPARDKNGVYKLFCLLTRPVISGVRFILPKTLNDRSIPVITFFILFVLWILLAYLRQVVV